MFDIASSELLVVAIVALLVVGPKDLPKLMRTVGQWVRRARMMTGQIRAGFDQMMQEAEFQEERERIMKMYPNPAPEPVSTPTPQYNEAVQTFSAAAPVAGAMGAGASEAAAQTDEAGFRSAAEAAEASVAQAPTAQTPAGQVLAEQAPAEQAPAEQALAAQAVTDPLGAHQATGSEPRS